MPAPLRRAVLALAAVLFVLAFVVTASLAGGQGVWPGGEAASATRQSPAPAAGATTARTDLPAGGVAAGPASGLAAAGRTRVDGAVTSADVVVMWNGTSARVPGGTPARGAGPPAPGTGAPGAVELDLRVTGGSGHGLAVVGIRNPTGRRLDLNGSLQLLVDGPGAPAGVRQQVRCTVLASGACTVQLPFRPTTPGVYRLRAVFVPS